MFFSLRRWFKKKGAVGFGRASTQANQVSLCRCSYRLPHALLPIYAYGAFEALVCLHDAYAYGAFEALVLSLPPPLP